MALSRAKGLSELNLEDDGANSNRSSPVWSSHPSVGGLASSQNINSSTIYFSTKHPMNRTQADLPGHTAEVDLSWEEEEEVNLRIDGIPVVAAFEGWNRTLCNELDFGQNRGTVQLHVLESAAIPIPFYGSSQERMGTIASTFLSSNPEITMADLSAYDVSSIRYLWHQFTDKPAPRSYTYNYSNPFDLDPLELESYFLEDAPFPFMPLDLYVPDAPVPPGGWPVILHIPGGQWGYQRKITPGVPVVLEELFNVSQSFAIASIGMRQINQHNAYPYEAAVKHPAELEDAVAALQFLIGKAAEVQLNPHRIIVHGLSSGGMIAAMLPVALAREPELANGIKLMGAMVVESPTELLSLQGDHFQGGLNDQGEVTCGTAASQLVGCGSTTEVSILNLTDMLHSVDLILSAAGVPHKLSSVCSANLTTLAKLREYDIEQELMTSIALASHPTTATLAEHYGALDLLAAIDVMTSLDIEHGIANLTVALLSAFTASPAIQVAGAHAEGHKLPPYLLFHTRTDSTVPSKQSWRLASALQDSGTDFTIFMPQFGDHTFYSRMKNMSDFWLASGTSTDSVRRVLVQHDLVQHLLPAWLDEIAFFDTA